MAGVWSRRVIDHGSSIFLANMSLVRVRIIGVADLVGGVFLGGLRYSLRGFVRMVALLETLFGVRIL